MNKHIKTLSVFKNQTKVISREVCDDIDCAFGNLISAMKGFGMAIIRIIGWLIGLSLILILPVATCIRLKCERDNEKAIRKFKREYMERMTCLHRKDEGK